MRQVFAIALIAAAAMTGVSHAGLLELSLSGAQLVSTGDGRSCIVVPMNSPAIDGEVSLGEVRLHMPRVELDSEREIALHVRVLASETYASESDLDPQLEGRLTPGGTTGDVDLGTLLRGVLTGREMHGLVVTSADARGFAAEDAAAVLAAVREGTLRASYRGAPGPPRG
jgi:hypothetical protein